MAFSPEEIRAYVSRLGTQGGSIDDLMSAAKRYGVPYADVGGAYGMDPSATMDYMGRNGVDSFNIGDFGMTGTDWLKSNGRGLDAQTPFSGGNAVLPGGYEWDGTLNWNDGLGEYLPFVDTKPWQRGARPSRGQPQADTGLGYDSNPLLGPMADAITQQFNTNLNQNVLPGLRRNADLVGGVGGSGAGIAEGLATGESNRGLADALTSMYFQDWTGNQNRELQKYGIDTSAETSRYGIDKNFELGSQGQELNFYGNQRGQDLQQLALASQLYGQGVDGMWGPLESANDILKAYAGLGSQTTSADSGGGILGALGGLLAGSQLWRAWG